MLSIESKMEVFARTYSKDTGVDILIGPNFCTNGKKIFVPPITDQHDAWIRFMTEVGVYHETGHIKTKDYTAFKAIKENSRRTLFNVVRDVTIEHAMETEYPGMRAKWIEFLTRYIQTDANKRFADPQVSAFKKVCDLLYLRGREKQLGVDLGVRVPVPLQEFFNKVLGRFVNALAAQSSIADSQKLTDEIYKALKDITDEQQEQNSQGQPQKGRPKKGKSEKQSGSSQSSEGDDSDRPQSDQAEDSAGEGDDGDSSEAQAGDGVEEDDNEKDDTGNESGDEGDDDESSADDSDGSGTGSGDSSDEKGDGSSGGDSDGDVDGEGDADGGGTEKGSSSSDEASDEGAEEDSDEGSGDSGLSDEAKDQQEQVQKDVEQDEGAKSIQEEAADQINEYADDHQVYREDVKDIYSVPMEGSDATVHEERGRKLTGYLGGKLRILLVSERAPVWQYNIRSGKLDTKKLWRVKTGSREFCKRRTEGVYEDACVYTVIDNSGSMKDHNGLYSKIEVAQGILTAVASDLDRLRVPFGVVGFGNSGHQGMPSSIRTAPTTLYLYKSFDEPYRRIRNRFC